VKTRVLFCLLAGFLLSLSMVSCTPQDVEGDWLTCVGSCSKPLLRTGGFRFLKNGDLVLLRSLQQTSSQTLSYCTEPILPGQPRSSFRINEDELVMIIRGRASAKTFFSVSGDVLSLSSRSGGSARQKLIRVQSVVPVGQCCASSCRVDNDCKACGTASRCLKSSPTFTTGRCTNVRSGQCPVSCTTSSHCWTQGCGNRLFCNTRTRKCVASVSEMCPARCAAAADCDPSKCGSFRNCINSSCRSACPSTCGSDKDCPAVDCLTAVHCYKNTPASTGTCRAKSTSFICPSLCSSSFQCFNRGCGNRTFCNTVTRKCVEEKHLCPRTCNSHADCPQDKCGKNAVCYKNSPTSVGVCRAPSARSCPSICSSDLQCLTTGCGERRYCNKKQRRCVRKEDVCPSVCEKDSDCPAAACGIATPGCYRATPTSSGQCRTKPNSPTCPLSCKSNLDCFNTGCGERLYCNTITKKCVKKDGLCNEACQKDDECKQNKCGGDYSACYRSHPSVKSGVCRLQAIASCPVSCTTSLECFVAGCGKRLYCDPVSKKCSDTASMCPATCQSDTDCKPGACGLTAACYKVDHRAKLGQCRAKKEDLTCPESCTSHFNCFVTGCGKRRYCNAKLNECVEESQLCPRDCSSDSDCSGGRCGANAFCYKLSPSQAKGYCQNKRSYPTCPPTCTTNSHCFVTGCGKKLYCKNRQCAL